MSAVDSLVRGLSANGGSMLSAIESRKPAEILGEVIVGILTGGIGVIVYEAYRHYRHQAYPETLVDLLTSLNTALEQCPFSCGVDVLFDGVHVSISEEFPGGPQRSLIIDVEGSTKSRVVHGKGLEDLTIALSKEVLANPVIYGEVACETARKALEKFE